MPTPEHLRTAIQTGILALLVLAPLPFGSVQPGAVLAIELTAAGLALAAIVLVGRDEEARAAIPHTPLAICMALIALGVFQLVPLPFSMAAGFNPTAELIRPVIPYLGLDHPPDVSWSVAAPETTDALLRFIAYVLIGLSAAVAFNTDRSRRRFAVVLVASAVFQAVYGSGEYLAGRQHIFAFAKKYYLDSATGTFINRNHFATLLAVALPFALVLAFPQRIDRRREERSWRDRFIALGGGEGLARLLAIGAAAIIWMGLLLSHSRAGLVAAMVAAAIVLVHFRAVRAARWASAIGAGVLLVLLSTELAQAPGERFLTVIEDIHSKGGRLTVWRDSLELIRTRPLLGWGFGTFQSAFPSVQSETIDATYDHAHNDWVEWGVEGGLLAIAVAGGLVLHALLRVSLPSRAALAAVVLHGFGDFSLRIPAVAVVAAAAIATGWGTTSVDRVADWAANRDHALPDRTPARDPRPRELRQRVSRPGNSRRRWGGLLRLGAFLAVTTVAALSVAVYRRTGALDDATAGREACAAVFGPRCEQLLKSARARAAIALEELNRPSDSGKDQLERYRDALDGSFVLFRDAVLRNPLSCRAINGLAATKWEKGVLTASPERASVAPLLNVAAVRSGRSADAQLDLAETAFRIGEEELAIRFAAAGVLLRPDKATRAVSVLLAGGVQATRLLSVLPNVPEVLIASKDAYVWAGRSTEYLDLIESWGGEWTPDLLTAVGDVGLRTYQYGRLEAILRSLDGRVRSRPFEARRQFYLAWTALSVGDSASAAAQASNARDLDPKEPAFDELLADCFIQRGLGSEALAPLNAALVKSAESWSPLQRARLLRKLGQAYELASQGDTAYDYYSRAVQLSPEEEFAANRLKALARVGREGELRRP